MFTERNEQGILVTQHHIRSLTVFLRTSAILVQCQNTSKKYSAIFEKVDGCSGAQSQQGILSVTNSDVNIIMEKFNLNNEFR